MSVMSEAERNEQGDMSPERMEQLRKMLDLVVHSSQCRFRHCQYPNCRQIKGLFRHGVGCEMRASGGCLLCKKIWYLLQLHARACDESQCRVPRCKDLKKHIARGDGARAMERMTELTLEDIETRD